MGLFTTDPCLTVPRTVFKHNCWKTNMSLLPSPTSYFPLSAFLSPKWGWLHFSQKPCFRDPSLTLLCPLTVPLPTPGYCCLLSC